MEIRCTIDTDDIDEDWDFESLLTNSLQKEIIKNANGKLASEKFKEFSALVSEKILAEVKLKMENFLSEEIVLTERYGEKSFVGSIEDLLKLRFDDVLLRPVDQYGKTLQGCMSSGKTWLEWAIEEKLGKSLQKKLDDAQKQIQSWTKDEVNKKLIEIKDTAIKEQVDNAFTSILKK